MLNGQYRPKVAPNLTVFSKFEIHRANSVDNWKNQRNSDLYPPSFSTKLNHD